MKDRYDLAGHGLGFLGAAAGGVLGHWAVGWIAAQGFYAMMVPGALLGLGGGAFLRRRSWIQASLCGVAALALGVVCEWRYFPFLRDGSFGYFLGHLGDLKPITLILIGGGALFGAWFGRGWRTIGEEID